MLIKATPQPGVGRRYGASPSSPHRGDAARQSTTPSRPSPDSMDELRTLNKDFRVDEGGQANFLTWHGPAESAVVVRPDSRVIAGFPAQNTGASLWLGEGSRVRAVGSPRGLATEDGQGIAMTLHSDKPELVVDEAVLGSIRTIRDRLHAEDGAEKVRGEREAFEHRAGLSQGWAAEQSRLEQHDGKQVLSFVRTGIDGHPYRASLTVGKDVSVQRRDGAWHLEASKPFNLEFQASVPHKPLGSYSPEELFSPRAAAVLKRVDGTPREDRVRSSLRGLLFLARKGKFMAGSWRFMTYFGRDTLLSSMMLAPVITDKAYKGALQSVIDRLSDQGKVAHEENLGPWAVVEHMRSMASALPHAAAPISRHLAEDLSKPTYDHSPVDGDFLLPVAMQKLFEKNPAGALEFLHRRSADGSSNLERVLTNWSQVLRAATPYAHASAAGEPREQCARQMVRIADGQNVGDWRDSQEGLGWGKYPGSVNLGLVATALRAVSDMASQVPGAELCAASRKAGLGDLPARIKQASAMAEEWDHADDAFNVRLSPKQVRQRLVDYFDKAPLSEGEKKFYRSRKVGDSSVTLGQFMDGQAVPPALKDGLTFKALSLDAGGKPVEVANTDAAMRLFMGKPPVKDVEETLKLLELEYPLGLMTGVGPVVSNPAYSLDPVHRQQLGRDAYHGAVVWSWQSAMLQVGLVKQMQRFSDRPELQKRLKAAAERIAQAERKAGPLTTSELWTHRVEDGDWKAVAFGANATDKTESNAVQLWSTVYPATLAWGQAAGVEL